MLSVLRDQESVLRDLDSSTVTTRCARTRAHTCEDQPPRVGATPAYNGRASSQAMRARWKAPLKAPVLGQGGSLSERRFDALSRASMHLGSQPLALRAAGVDGGWQSLCFR